MEQEPLILSDTVLNNILFGKELNAEQMQKTVKASQLEEDLSQFPQGIETYIGEQGVNISGGQRARIALAWALYSDADILLLDDPLSAVDPGVAQRIFQDCVMGSVLTGKAVILVTHQLHFIENFNKILLLDSHGS